MLSVFSITLPFFALVLMGYLATKRGFLPLAAIPGLNAYVLFFALPCMLFRFGASTPIVRRQCLHRVLALRPHHGEFDDCTDFVTQNQLEQRGARCAGGGFS
jgi:hypothetical protein